MKLIGAQGEQLVATYLQKQGFIILARNFYIRGGEIDLIARKKNILVFVEVKSRSTQYFNTSEVITLSKQKKIILTAKYFLSQNTQLDDTIYRFDVALVNAFNQKITYIPNAFTASYE